jgi:hypothetical protein
VWHPGFLIHSSVLVRQAIGDLHTVYLYTLSQISLLVYAVDFHQVRHDVRVGSYIRVIGSDTAHRSDNPMLDIVNRLKKAAIRNNRPTPARGV